jgi:hypothetical protein
MNIRLGKAGTDEIAEWVTVSGLDGLLTRKAVNSKGRRPLPPMGRPLSGNGTRRATGWTTHGHEDHDGGLAEIALAAGVRVKAHVLSDRLICCYPDDVRLGVNRDSEDVHGFHLFF